MLLARESVNSGLLFDLAKLDAEIKELTQKSEAEDFWNDRNSALETISRLNHSREIVETYRALLNGQKDLEELLEFEDDSFLEQIETSLDELNKQSKDFELQILFNGEFDNLNAILEIHPGAGGTEAQDWADMLYRMYVYYAEIHHFKMSLLSFEPGDEAGIKSVTMLIEGLNAYGYLRSEKGIHRLVRISPFDANARRHTSFASCDVTPELEDDDSIEINWDEVRIDTYRSSGAGGQHVNKTDSAVRMTHIPTGIVVQCQNERSQIQNREQATMMLKSKLAELKEREKLAQLNDLKGELKKIEWGSQIRSYVFHPYTMVKDHRTNEETGNINAVMDGDIDMFINAYLIKS